MESHVGNVDDQLVGSCESQEEKVALWRARSLLFKTRRTWNVIHALVTGEVSVRQGIFALRYPAHVVGLAIKRSRGGGMLLVCPAAVEACFSMQSAINLESGK